MKKKLNKRFCIRTGAMLLSALMSLALFSGCTGRTGMQGDSSDISTQIPTSSDTEKNTMNNERPSAPSESEAARLGYVIVTDFLPANGVTDVTEALQDLIDRNPNRTLYFPDGTYLISAPIKTSAKWNESVSFELSNFAVIKADPKKWLSDEAMIRLGGQKAGGEPAMVGSNYYFAGGVVDGAGVADGISIDSGRETVVRDTSIKNTRIGLRVKHGVNGGSSDADIHDINIYGNGKSHSVGILVEGLDNTFSNIRIGCVKIGVRVRSAGNMFRNIHPLYHIDISNYEGSVGFYDDGGNNRYDYCYSDHFRVGFRIGDGRPNSVFRSYFHNCFVFWYDDGGAGAPYGSIAFYSDGKFNSVVTNFEAGFRTDRKSYFLYETTPGGNGVFQYAYGPSIDNMAEDDAYQKYLKN